MIQSFYILLCVLQKLHVFSSHMNLYKIEQFMSMMPKFNIILKYTVICNFSEFVVTKTLTWIIFCVYILQKSDQSYKKKNVKLFQILESLRIKICRRACPGRVEGLIPEWEGTDPKKQSIEQSPTDASSLTLPPSRTWRWPVA